MGARGQVELCRAPRPPGRAGTVGSRWVGKPVLESGAPRNAVSCATRGQQRLGNEPTCLRRLSLEGSGLSSGLWGVHLRRRCHRGRSVCTGTSIGLVGVFLSVLYSSQVILMGSRD